MASQKSKSGSGRYYGWKRSNPDRRDLRFSVLPEVMQSLPASVDLKAGMGPVLDQSSLGSCGPNAADSLLLFDQYKQGIAVSSASRLQIYYATRILMDTVSEDSGVDNRTLLKALAQYGFADESLWPYDISKFTVNPPQAIWSAAAASKIASYASVPQRLDALKGCLASGFPFLFGFTVYSSFESSAVDQTGEVPMPGSREQVLGGHDVVIYSYDDKTQRFGFKNSWGTGWAKGGYGTFPYSYATEADLSGDFWVINAVPGSGPVTPPVPPPVPTPVPMFPPLHFNRAVPRGNIITARAPVNIPIGASLVVYPPGVMLPADTQEITCE